VVPDENTPSRELLVYQIGELKAVTERGFERMDASFDRIDRRVTALEEFRAVQEERNSSGPPVAQITAALTAILSAIGGVIYVLASHT
jgi:hypothetical protein